MSNRKIYLVGEINGDAYLAFAEKLDAMEGESDEPITIELNSGGGVAYDGLAFYSRIRTSRCPTTVIVVGLCASASGIILIGATKRIMTRESWFMVHEDNASVDEGKVTSGVSEMKQLVRMENQWNKILAAHTNVPAKTWARMNLNTTYLNAERCLELGIIDEII